MVSFVALTECFIYQRLKKDKRYQELFDLQQGSSKLVNKILKEIQKEDRLSIEDYYDNELLLASLEANEYYIQGILDGVQLLFFLGLLKERNPCSSVEGSNF